MRAANQHDRPNPHARVAGSAAKRMALIVTPHRRFHEPGRGSDRRPTVESIAHSTVIPFLDAAVRIQGRSRPLSAAGGNRPAVARRVARRDPVPVSARSRPAAIGGGTTTGGEEDALSTSPRAASTGRTPPAAGNGHEWPLGFETLTSAADNTFRRGVLIVTVHTPITSTWSSLKRRD